MRRALIGNGGHAREVLSYIGEDTIRFVDDIYYKGGEDKNLLPLSMFSPYEFEVMIAIGESEKRSSVASKLPFGTKYFSYIHPTAIISGRCKIGMGYFIGPNSILTCDIEIGDHLLLNRGCHIGHDCRIGNFFSGMPGSIVSGNVTIGDRVYIGTNSSVREKLTLCDDVKIGMGTSVIKNIEIPGTYFDKKIITRQDDNK